MFFHLIPLDTVPRRWTPPDLLIAFAFAWSLRRPDYAPAASIAAVMLMADLVVPAATGADGVADGAGQRIPQTRASGLREASFAGEWLAVCLSLLAITVLNRLTLGLLAVEQAQLSLSLIQMVMTMIAYPLVVLVSQSLMGVRKPAPSDTDAMGGWA